MHSPPPALSPSTFFLIIPPGVGEGVGNKNVKSTGTRIQDCIPDAGGKSSDPPIRYTQPVLQSGSGFVIFFLSSSSSIAT